MAKLVAICGDEEAFPFERRQIPPMIEDTLTVGQNLYENLEINRILFILEAII